MYKFLRLIDDEIRSNSGDMTWEIGEWQEVKGQPVLCESGLHCSGKLFDAFSYVRGEIVAEVEVSGASDKGGDKEAWERMRIVRAWHWRKKDSVALAICAAELVLDLYENQFPNDDRPRKAIEAAKLWIENPSTARADADDAAAADAAAAAARAAYAAYAADADAADAAYAADAAARAAYAAARAAYAARADAADAAYAAAAYAADAAAAKAEIIEKINRWMERRLLEPYSARLASEREA